MKFLLGSIAVFFGSFFFSQSVIADPLNLDDLSWNITILIDQSETVFGDSQLTRPRNNRGLAISPDGQFLYAGYNDSLYSGGEVRRIDLTLDGNVAPVVSRVTGARGKSIAVDDVGRVYLAEGTSILIYDASLSSLLFTVFGLTNSEGVAVVREDGLLILYNSDRTAGTLEKRILTEDGDGISSADLDLSFGTDGAIFLTENLRGVEVDDLGRVWVSGFGNDTVYRISSDGAVVDSIGVSSPMDIGFDGSTVLVTRYTDRLISRLDRESLSSLGTDLVPAWDNLALDPDGQGAGGALSGIVVLPGEGFYVANEQGQTLPFEDPPGSGIFTDDNDPILFAWTCTIPGDFDNDCDVDLKDFAILSGTWLSMDGDAQWNPVCDINQPADQVIDILDLQVFVMHWLERIVP